MELTQIISKILHLQSLLAQESNMLRFLDTLSEAHGIDEDLIDDGMQASGRSASCERAIERLRQNFCGTAKKDAYKNILEIWKQSCQGEPSRNIGMQKD